MSAPRSVEPPSPSACERDAADDARYWQRRTALLRAQVNAGWWLSAWLQGVLLVAIGGAFAVLWTRWQHEAAVPVVWQGIAGALAVAALAAWWSARPHFESAASARVLLEDAAGLHARLTAAAAGVGPWPARPADGDRRWPVVWRWRRPLALATVVTTMLAAATFVPMATARGIARQVIEKPRDAAVVERWNEALRRDAVIDEASGEAIDRRIADLLERPRDRWYENSSLEAAATLREQTAADLDALARNLDAAREAAARLAAATDGGSAADKAATAAALAAAAERLAGAALRPGTPFDRARLGAGLSAEQCRDLAASLRDNGQRLRAALAQAGGIELTFVESKQDAPCNACQGCRMGGPCDHAHVSRGPGATDNRFTDREQRSSARPEQLGVKPDADRAAPGQLLGVVDGDQTPEPEAFTGPQAGGAVADPGAGGSAARVDDLLPGERDTVRRYFGQGSTGQGSSRQGSVGGSNR